MYIVHRIPIAWVLTMGGSSVLHWVAQRHRATPTYPYTPSWSMYSRGQVRMRPKGQKGGSWQLTQQE